MKVKQSSFRIIFINEFKFKTPISDKRLRNDKCIIGTLDYYAVWYNGNDFLHF